MTYYYNAKQKTLHLDKLAFGSKVVDSDWVGSVDNYIIENNDVILNIDSDIGIFRKELSVLSEVAFTLATIKGSGKFTLQAAETNDGVSRKHIMEVLITKDSIDSFCIPYASLSTDIDLFDIRVESVNDSETNLIIVPLNANLKSYKISGMIL